MKIKIETSARHIHLTKEDYEALFGDKKPSEIKELGQKQFACKESVKLVGPKNQLEKVRLVTPFRKFSQVEISKTDSIYLGIDAPLRISGDLSGAAEIIIAGEKGKINGNFAIVAKRHIHLPLETARELNLEHNKAVSVKIAGERAAILDEVIVRTQEHFDESIHLDTDEANAVGINKEGEGEIIF